MTIKQIRDEYTTLWQELREIAAEEELSFEEWQEIEEVLHEEEDFVILSNHHIPEEVI